MPSNLCTNINFSNNSVINKKPPNNIDKGNKDYSSINNQDLIIAYNKVIQGSKKVLLFNILGEDKDTWHNNSEILIGTYLDIFSEESGKKIKVIFLEKPIMH